MAKRDSPAKSSFKKGTQAAISAPPETYTHPDPLLRRLRLRDKEGKPVDLLKEFRDTEIVGFLFGAQWSRQEKQFYQDFSNLCRQQPHRFKGVYVSVDAEETAYTAAARNQVWLAMEWNDGSNLPTSSHDTLPSDTPLAHHNSESFLLASEPDLEESLALSPSTPPSTYLRPYSRVHLAAKWDVLAVPSLVIYHVGQKKVVQNWVSLRSLREDKVADSWAKWSRGEKTDGVNLKEFVKEYRFSVIFCVLAIIYVINVRLLQGDNFIAKNLVGLAEMFRA